MSTGVLSRKGHIGQGEAGSGHIIDTPGGMRMVRGGRRFLDTRAAAQALGVTPRRIIALIEDQRLPAEKFGRDWLIDPADLDRPEVRNRRPGRPRTEPGGEVSS